jgi:hypothetical protein
MTTIEINIEKYEDNFFVNLTKLENEIIIKKYGNYELKETNWEIYDLNERICKFKNYYEPNKNTARIIIDMFRNINISKFNIVCPDFFHNDPNFCKFIREFFVKKKIIYEKTQIDNIDDIELYERLIKLYNKNNCLISEISPPPVYLNNVLINLEDFSDENKDIDKNEKTPKMFLKFGANWDGHPAIYEYNYMIYEENGKKIYKEEKLGERFDENDERGFHEKIKLTLDNILSFFPEITHIDFYIGEDNAMENLDKIFIKDHEINKYLKLVDYYRKKEYTIRIFQKYFW